MVFLHLANYLVQQNATRAVFVFVYDSNLKQQIEMKKELFPNKSLINMIYDGDFSRRQSRYPDGYFIIDEADKVIENKLMDLRS